MDIDQKRSFIARIRCNETPMTFFDQHPDTEQLKGKGNLLTTPHAHSETTDDMLRYRTISGNKDMTAYFRCYDDYYNIQIRSTAYFSYFFSKNPHGIIGAFPPAGGNTTSFNLLNANLQIVTLDDIETNQVSVFLKARNAGTINRQLMRNPHIYSYGDHAGTAAKFNLTILERNVPYPTGATPYA